MSEQEHAKVGELVMRRQAAKRRLLCASSEAQRMADSLHSAVGHLRKAAKGERPAFTELQGCPDREDIEQILEAVCRELNTIDDFQEKLGEMGVST